MQNRDQEIKNSKKLSQPDSSLREIPHSIEERSIKKSDKKLDNILAKDHRNKREKTIESYRNENHCVQKLRDQSGKIIAQPKMTATGQRLQPMKKEHIIELRDKISKQRSQSHTDTQAKDRRESSRILPKSSRLPMKNNQDRENIEKISIKTTPNSTLSLFPAKKLRKKISQEKDRRIHDKTSRDRPPQELDNLRSQDIRDDDKNSDQSKDKLNTMTLSDKSAKTGKKKGQKNPGKGKQEIKHEKKKSKEVNKVIQKLSHPIKSD